MSDDDTLLKALGEQLGREDDEAARLAGALDGGDADALTDPPADPAALLAALAPLSDDERGALTSRLDAALAPLSDDERDALTSRLDATPDGAAPDETHGSAQVVAFPWRRAVLIGAPLLAAAAALFFMLRPAELPHYELTVRGAGHQEVRSAVEASAGPLELRLGDGFDFVVRPAEPVEGEVELRAFVVAGGEARRWAAPVERGRSGSFRVRGKAGADLELDSAVTALVFEVGAQRFEVAVRLRP